MGSGVLSWGIFVAFGGYAGFALVACLLWVLFMVYGLMAW